MREITSIVYSNICRGLFNSHKLIFAFMIATRIALQANEVSAAEWNLFLKGVIIDGPIKPLRNPDPPAITDKTWRFVLNLECTHPSFEGLAGSVANEIAAWRAWYKAKDPQNLELPGGWEESLSRFQKLLVFKAFREDKLVFKMREFVEKELGHSFAHPQPVLMDDVFKDSDNKTPIIFVLS